MSPLGVVRGEAGEEVLADHLFAAPAAGLEERVVAEGQSAFVVEDECIEVGALQHGAEAPL